MTSPDASAADDVDVVCRYQVKVTLMINKLGVADRKSFHFIHSSQSVSRRPGNELDIVYQSLSLEASFNGPHCCCCCCCCYEERLKVSRLGVLETWVLVSTRLETRFYKSWSRSWSWDPRVSVSVLVLGLGTMKTRSSSLMKREIETK